jgi:ATP-binding cassette subfamily B protein
VQLLILEKANTLDLAFFENPEFYDKMRQAADQSTYQPVSMISQTFDLFQTTVTMFSMIFLLLQLSWWLAIVALLIPIPAFFSSIHYGWRGFQRKRRQSPERRVMDYFTRLMTTDTYNKEVKLFTLGGFFIRQFKRLADKLYEEDKEIVVRRYLANLLWTALTGIANSAIYLYVALQVVLSLGRISLGSLSRYTQAAVQAGQSFQGLLGGISSTYENNLYITTLFEFLAYEPQIVSPSDPQPVKTAPGNRGLDLEFRNVSFTYPGKDPETRAKLSHWLGATALEKRPS